MAEGNSRPVQKWENTPKQRNPNTAKKLAQMAAAYGKKAWKTYYAIRQELIDAGEWTPRHPNANKGQLIYIIIFISEKFRRQLSSIARCLRRQRRKHTRL